MITDSIQNLKKYTSSIPYAAELQKLFLSGSAEGSPVEIRLKAYDTKPDDRRRFEVHFHTIDLMIALSGEEAIHIAAPEDLTPAEFLPDGADGQKLDGAPCGERMILRENAFIAIFPGEAHMVAGQVTPGCAAPLKKWVVKIPADPVSAGPAADGLRMLVE